MPALSNPRLDWFELEIAKSGQFYLYAFWDAEGAIAYIGKGSGSRFQNQKRRMARKGSSAGKIIWTTDNEDKAYRAERLLIYRNKPIWNKRPGGTGGRGPTKRQKLRGMLEKLADQRLNLKSLKRWATENPERIRENPSYEIDIWKSLIRGNWQLRRQVRLELEATRGSSHESHTA